MTKFGKTDLTKVIKNWKTGFILIADKDRKKLHSRISGVSLDELMDVVVRVVVDLVKEKDGTKAVKELRKDVEEALMKRLAGKSKSKKETKEKIDTGYIG